MFFARLEGGTVFVAVSLAGTLDFHIAVKLHGSNLMHARNGSLTNSLQAPLR